MWKATTHECVLKKAYDASQNTIPCEDCVSFAQGGKYFVYMITHHHTKHKDRSWEYRDDKGIYMPMDIAENTCKIDLGYDQPAKYDLLSVPMVVKYSYICCNECAKRDGTALSLDLPCQK